MPSVLLIDDNEEIQEVNENYLTAHGFDVTRAYTGIKALGLLDTNKYDCIVLDVLLPDLDGFALCKAARTVTDTPIMFLSCLEESEDKVKGLMHGGDDYMTKPYSLKELLARLQVLLRRSEPKSFIPGNFFIDRNNKIIHANGKSVMLSEREFNLFLLFYDNPKKIFSKEELLEKIWYGCAEIGVVNVLVLRLRRKIEFAENIVGRIGNKQSVGYSLTTPEGEEA